MANIMRTGGGLVEMGIIPDDYMLQATSMGYIFGGFDGKRIPLVEEKTINIWVNGVSASATAKGDSGPSTSASSTNGDLTVKATLAPVAKTYRATAEATYKGHNVSTTQLVWLGTDYEALKQKTSGTIVVWLEPTN